ncbi:hypothetical protein [Vulcanisaeta thermophila]|uniref:hypothetical protein n=1 Tax=Vulcanisaeta thermophila TaxID=867917 RepID=UPI000853E8F9|nr:hypothetical protein [Vulcanisaeta thermophila]
MTLSNELRRTIEELVMRRLNEVKERVETLGFVNSIIEELGKMQVRLSEDEEAEARAYVVDVLWSLSKRGVVSMDDDLLHFTVRARS